MRARRSLRSSLRSLARAVDGATNITSAITASRAIRVVIFAFLTFPLQLPLSALSVHPEH
jgi:hypothetical protein